MLVSAIKLIVPLVIITLLCCVLVPMAANALPSFSSYGLNLPIPHHLIGPSYSNSMSISSSNNNLYNNPYSNSYSNLHSNSYRHSDSGHTKNQYMPTDPTSGLNIPKNLIVPKTCTQNCTAIIGTQKDDVIIATDVTDAIIYGLDGNDIIQCGLGNCKAYGGSGDNVLISGSSSSAQLYGGSGNNIFIGGFGDTLMVGGKGNDQFYAGSSHDVMIGGGGANYFDCGINGNGVILDFNAKNGDTKASNCKFVIIVHTGVQTAP
jgi:Ca2+-binding RTX toxin-like protein